MSHLATADEADDTFVGEQIDRFRAVVDAFPGVAAHLANSAGALRHPGSRFDAVRCGVALYGLSPFGRDPGEDGLEPVLSWRSYVAQARTLGPGESTGYGRRFVADEPTRVGLVPVGYADGFRRGLSGTEVLVGGARRRVVGSVSMDALAVELGDEPVGSDVTLIGDGVLVEEHARVLGTINYEVTCGLNRRPEPRGAAPHRWMSASARPSATGRPGWSAAPCATSSSVARSSTSTWPAPIPSWPPASTRA